MPSCLGIALKAIDGSLMVSISPALPNVTPWVRKRLLLSFLMQMHTFTLLSIHITLH